MNYVIIGNSAAGIGAVEGIRQIDKHGGITIVTNEPYHTYSRPLISYLLHGKVTEEKMQYRDAGFYEKNECKLLSGVAASSVNSNEKYVLLENGEKLHYDKLLVATGASALVPEFEGLAKVKEKFTFMSLGDAYQLDKTIDPSKNVLIVGAGLIGLKCAEGILGRVQSVTVVDLAPGILSSILDESGASLVQKHLENEGVKFLLSQSVARFEENAAVLDNGKRIDFDILVLAVGVSPNVGLLEGIAEIDKGIVINAKSETTAADIYAAGDCTQTLDISCGLKKIMAILPNAYIQGECAGINMAGGEKTFEKAIPMNAIGFCGLSIITAGNYAGQAYTKSSVNEGNEGCEYKRLFYSENKLNGYIMVGNVEKAGIYTSLIREQTPLESIDFALVCEKPGLMAFTKEHRNSVLAQGD